MGKLGKAQLEEAIAKWFRETDGLYPLDEIVNKFYENSKETIVAALENLKEKGVLYGGSNVVNCTYGYAGEGECLADNLISMNINGNSFNAVFATINDKESITENPSIEESKISKKVKNSKGKIAGKNEKIIINGQFSIVVPEGYTYSMNKNEIGQHRELVFIKEVKNDTYTDLEDFSLDSPFPAPQCLTIMVPNSLSGPHDLSSKNVREGLRNLLREGLREIKEIFGFVVGGEKLTAIKETSNVLVYYTEFAGKNRNTNFMILTAEYIYNGQIWLNDISTKQEREQIAKKWLKTVESSVVNKTVSSPKKTASQKSSAKIEEKKAQEKKEETLQMLEKAKEQRAENKKHMKKVENECASKFEKFEKEVNAFISDKKKSFKEEYGEKVKKLQQEICMIEEQIKVLSIFKFKEKKNLKLKIESLTKQIEHYSNPSTIKSSIGAFEDIAKTAKAKYNKELKDYLKKRFYMVEDTKKSTKNEKVTNDFLKKEIVSTLLSIKHGATVNEIIDKTAKFKNNSKVTNMNVSAALSSLASEGYVTHSIKEKMHFFELDEYYAKKLAEEQLIREKEQLIKEIDEIQKQYSESSAYANVPYPEPPSIESVFKSVE